MVVVAAVGSLIVPVAETSLVVPDAVTVSEPSLAVGSEAMPSVTVASVFEFEFEFDSEASLVQAPVRADRRDKRHALRFIIR
ncbi:MAG: hypothetical protein H0T76_25590 [Nannocystis sp.]|nr:hypothetical protein [Nannocystis sp.]MBA3549867.1 hypothetical protein [Nannocystis sp.]